MGKHGSPHVKRLIAKQKTKQAGASQLGRYTIAVIKAAAQVARDKQRRGKSG